MQEPSAKENILKKIRRALGKPVPVPFAQNEGSENIFVPPQKEIEIEFAKNFTDLLGKFSFCLHQKELAAQLYELIEIRKWKNIYCLEDVLKKNLNANGFTINYTTSLAGCDAAITGCELLIARTGSILLSSAQQSGRTTSVYAPVHICIAYANQIVYDIKDGLLFMKEKYGNRLPSLITFATGPSRTADIEKTLVTGVHGPKEVFCFMVEV
ncbi:MAG: LUD domain-containing protein [Parafilimonas sp.]